jgi:hypothetical protein
VERSSCASALDSRLRSLLPEKGNGLGRLLVPNSLHVLEENLLTAAIIQLCRPAVGVAGNTLSGFKSAVTFQQSAGSR